MNRERLQRLITILEAVKPETFSINTWHSTHPCGTVACALGWAAMDHRFQAEGLHLAKIGVYLAPHYKDAVSFAAGAEFFELEYPQAERLFANYTYYYPGVTPQCVIFRIKELLDAQA